MDVICQAKSGMGKTAVFVLSVLQQLEPVDKEVAALIICHTRELAYQVCLRARLDLRLLLYSQHPGLNVACLCSAIHTGALLQICHEFERFSTYMPNVQGGQLLWRAAHQDADRAAQEQHTTCCGGHTWTSEAGQTLAFHSLPC